MEAILGTYKDGYVKLNRNFLTKKPVKVIVTFLEEVQTITEKRLSLSDFSFAKSQENLSDYKGSFSDSVIEERQAER